MNRASLWIHLTWLLAAGGCDLPELSQDMAQQPADMAAPPSPSPAGDLATPPGPTGGNDLSSPGVGPDLATVDDGTIPPGAKIGSCDPTQWAVTASLSHPVNPPSYAVDGLQPTRWSTGAPQAVGQYYQIDFGGFVMVSQVVIEHTFANDGKDDYARGLDVLVSYDGVDFSRKLQSGSYTADPGVATIAFAPHAARQLRLQSNSVAGSWWTMHELHVGCTAPGSPADAGVSGPDLGGPPTGALNPGLTNWTATASSVSPNDSVTNAFDGKLTTRWATGKNPQYGDEWFKLDLGQKYDLSQVWLTTANMDWPSAWELDLSSDNVTYTRVASGLGALVTKMVFPTQPARYVLIKQIGSGYDAWWSIYELSVYQ
jgi:hypothetical protein